ncbi:MAG: hypothetical protein ACXACY_21965 [Candidatus Hodarchaeales archaeon]|jgi:hypothetical protein
MWTGNNRGRRMNNFTDYSTKTLENRTDVTPARKAFVKWTQDMKDKAATTDTFGGRRLLGTNKNGTPVYISYTIDRETLDLQIKTTHELSSLLEDGAKLCPRRVTLANNAQMFDLDHAMREATRIDTGEVTEKTIKYLQKIIDLPIAVGKVDGKCSSQLFMYVSNAVYEGETSIEKGVRWSDILHTWDFPSGSYFTIY